MAQMVGWQANGCWLKPLTRPCVLHPSLHPLGEAGFGLQHCLFTPFKLHHLTSISEAIWPNSWLSIQQATLTIHDTDFRVRADHLHAGNASHSRDLSLSRQILSQNNKSLCTDLGNSTASSKAWTCKSAIGICLNFLPINFYFIFRSVIHRNRPCLDSNER